MITKIIIPEEYNISKIMFMGSIDLTVLPDSRIVPLFGPNGVGKTTLLKAVQTGLQQIYSPFDDDKDDPYMLELLEKEKRKYGCEVITDGAPYKLLGYFNSEDNLRSRKPRSIGDDFDPYLLNARFDARSVSEGQSIVYSLLDLFDLIGTGKDSLQPDGRDIIVLIDEFDSGLSIDNIGIMMRKLKNTLRKRNDVQVVFSFNNPYILTFFSDVISLYDGTVRHMETTKDMLDEINRNKKLFDKARRKSDGRPKIYE